MLPGVALGGMLFGSLLAGGCGGDPTNLTVTPPLNRTALIDPDVLSATDTSTFSALVSMGQAQRTMPDGRTDGSVVVDAHIFGARFDDGLSAEVQVSPEFDSGEALALAGAYAEIVGRLPAVLRAEVRRIWIQGGEAPLVGADSGLLIHTGVADALEVLGFLEEELAHQAVHTSLDEAHAASAGWLAAQEGDPTYISGVAQESPTVEDVAESFVAFLAVRYQEDRITAFLAATIVKAIPTRLEYFEAQGFDMYPLD